MSRWAFVRCGGRPSEPDPSAVAEALMILSPMICLASDGVWLELGGSARLLGGASGVEGERLVAMQALGVVEALRSEAGVAVADRRATARLLAPRSGREVIVVEPGCDARALATLSLSALGASPRAAEYLEQLGVRTGATLARLSPLAVRRRLGSEGERLVRLTRAEPEPRPERFCPPDQPSARCELEPPLPPGEALLFLVKRLLDELTLRLAGRGLAVGELRLTLAFEGGLEVIEELMLPRPLVTTPPLLAMLQERLLNPALPQSPDSDDDLPPPRLTELEARVTRTAPVPRAQLSLLHRQEVELERLAELLARLTNVLGRDQVFTAELVPTHLPEESWRRGASGESLETGEQRLETGEQRLEISPRPALVLPAPLLLEGELIQGDELRWEGGSGVIAYIWGPERLRGRWWAMPFDRDYYVVDLVEGARIWVFRERGSTTLRLQGVFD